MARDGGHTTSLLAHEPALAETVPAAERAEADEALSAPCLTIEPGAWAPPPRDRWPRHAVGLLLLEGIVTREVVLAERPSAEVLGPGDVIAPWEPPDALVPALTRWTVDDRVVALVLDAHLLAAASRWPGLAEQLHARIASQGAREAVHTAICQLGRVEQRLVAELWHLAERFGRRTDEGVVVPIRLTHESLGRLVGAQRPTITLALRALAKEGVVRRRGDGAWLLADGSQDPLAPPADRLPRRERGTGPVAMAPDRDGRLIRRRPASAAP